MTWLAVSAFLKSALTKLGQLNIWQLLCIAALLFAGLQTIRLHSEQRHNAKLTQQLTKVIAAREADRKAYVAAQEQAAALALKQKQDTEARYAALANEKDQEYALGLQNGRAAALSYIAAHGMQSQHSSPSGGPSTPAKDNSPVLPAKLPADPVVVSAGDVQACTAATAYAIAAHNWAISLTNDGSQPK